MTYISKRALGLSISAAALIMASPAHAGSLIIALSPDGDAALKRAEAIDAIKLATQGTDLGETSQFINGLTGKSICAFTVPPKKSYRSDKAKINSNKACVAKIMAFAESAGNTAHAGALDIPATLRTIVKDYDVENIDAIAVFGSPIYDDVREPALSMAGAYVGSHAHISTSLSESHYALGGLEGTLNGTPVHISSEGYDWIESTRHGAAVEEFWSLSVAHLGGALVTMNQDRTRVIDRVKAGIRKPVQTYTADASNKLEMIYVGPVDADTVPIQERELSTRGLTRSQITRARDVELGITWDCACDIDIHVRPYDDADILYFANSRTRDGLYFKDYRTASELSGGYETVELNRPVDLNNVAIGLNFYSGQSPAAVTGEIRVALGRQTYARAFTIDATTGNKGNGRGQAFQTLEAPNTHWVMMSAADIVADQISATSGG